MRQFMRTLHTIIGEAVAGLRIESGADASFNAAQVRLGRCVVPLSPLTVVRKWITALAVAVLPALASAQFTFTTNNGKLTVTGYKGPGGAVVIPSATNGMTVAGVEYPAFFGLTNVTSVMIPGTVLSVGSMAFETCWNLTNATLAEGVSQIEEMAFCQCSHLTSIALPGTLTNIAHEAFYDCPELSGVTIPGSVRTIGYAAFAHCADLAELTIPEGVRSIGEAAFSGCANLRTVTIPASVSNIDIGWAGLFWDCGNLTSISVDARNSLYCSVDGVLFSKDATELISARRLTRDGCACRGFGVGVAERMLGW
jgi:BspA type Leucine rich repeat region (6 copies)